MITTKKDIDGKIVGYFIYENVDVCGNYSVNGDYVYVTDLWIHENFRNKKVIIELINDAVKNTKSTYVYWTKEKTGNLSRLYKIKSFLKFKDMETPHEKER